MKPTYEQLEQFVKSVAKLTINHDVVQDHAVVFANKLGDELEKVDPEWWLNDKEIRQ